MYKRQGVSNFYEEWLDRIEAECEIVPMVNQMELNPYTQKKQLRAYCAKKQMQMEAYTPLARGMVNDDAVIQAIAERHGKNCVQVTLRFLMKEGIVVIPRTNNPERMKSNIDLYDFVLDASEMEQMRQLDRCEILTLSLIHIYAAQPRGFVYNHAIKHERRFERDVYKRQPLRRASGLTAIRR